MRTTADDEEDEEEEEEDDDDDEEEDDMCRDEPSAIDVAALSAVKSRAKSDFFLISARIADGENTRT